MIAFVDNDVIVKLAACDLLDDTLTALRLTASSIFVPPSAPFSLFVRKGQEKGQKKYGVETHTRICRFVGQVNTVSAEPDPRALEVLSNIEGIDAGEKVLIALCARNSDSILITGDKRAIRALASAAGLDEIRSALEGRVCCLEQVIAATIRQIGFEAALPRILGGCHQDTSLQSVFGSGTNTTEMNAFAGLQNYVADLRKDAAGLLHESLSSNP